MTPRVAFVGPALVAASAARRDAVLRAAGLDVIQVVLGSPGRRLRALPSSVLPVARARLRHRGPLDRAELSGALRHLPELAAVVRAAPTAVHLDGDLGIGPATELAAALARLGLPRPSVTLSARDRVEVLLDGPARLAALEREVAGIHVEGLWAAPGATLGCALWVVPEAPLPLPDPDDRPGPDGVRGTPGSPLRVLVADHFDATSGVDLVARAAALLAARGVHAEITLLGDGPNLVEAAFTAHVAGLDRDGSPVTVRTEGRSRGHGGPDDESLVAHAERADVVVHPSLLGPDGPGPQAAAAWGRPCVVLAESAAGGPGALSLPRRDPAAVADTLEALARDPEARARLGRATRAARPAPTAVVAGWEAVFADRLGSGWRR